MTTKTRLDTRRDDGLDTKPEVVEAEIDRENEKEFHVKFHSMKKVQQEQLKLVIFVHNGCIGMPNNFESFFLNFIFSSIHTLHSYLQFPNLKNESSPAIHHF